MVSVREIITEIMKIISIDANFPQDILSLTNYEKLNTKNKSI